jgi:hypothetical protein
MTLEDDPVPRFHALLLREREAVRAADLQALDVLQDEKRALLRELRSVSIDDPRLDELGAFARYNVGLIRHLVSILRSMAGLPEPAAAYGGRGQSVPASVPARIRGAA